MVLVLGGLMVMVGLAFKLSAVPFHFWCPDVFEGASAEVNAFLSVASKAAALALLVRVVGRFRLRRADGCGGELRQKLRLAASQSVQRLKPQACRAVRRRRRPRSCSVCRSQAKRRSPLDPSAGDCADHCSRSGPRVSWPCSSAFLAAITCTFGNLAAYGQTNIKRLLAYSTIAHAGYMMMPIAAGLVLAGKNPAAAEAAFAAVPFYAGVYLFMNLGAFAIVALSAQRAAQRRDRRLCRADPPFARSGDLLRLHSVQPDRHAAAGRFCGQVRDFLVAWSTRSISTRLAG